jgi:hypothetical protein
LIIGSPTAIQIGKGMEANRVGISVHMARSQILKEILQRKLIIQD